MLKDLLAFLTGLNSLSLIYIRAHFASFGKNMVKPVCFRHLNVKFKLFFPPSFGS